MKMLEYSYLPGSRGQEAGVENARKLGPEFDLDREKGREGGQTKHTYR